MSLDKCDSIIKLKNDFFCVCVENYRIKKKKKLSNSDTHINFVHLLIYKQLTAITLPLTSNEISQ